METNRSLALTVESKRDIPEVYLLFSIFKEIPCILKRTTPIEIASDLDFIPSAENLIFSIVNAV